METEIEYTVVYQKKGDPNWWVHDPKYVHRSGTWSTSSFDEAYDHATGLKDGRYVTDTRPKYRARVMATKIEQRVTTGSTIVTFGELTEGPLTR